MVRDASATGARLIERLEQAGQAAGVPEDDRAAVEPAGPDGADEPGQALRGVDRVDEEALGAGKQAGGLVGGSGSAGRNRGRASRRRARSRPGRPGRRSARRARRAASRSSVAARPADGRRRSRRRPPPSRPPGARRAARPASHRSPTGRTTAATSTERSDACSSSSAAARSWPGRAEDAATAHADDVGMPAGRPEVGDHAGDERLALRPLGGRGLVDDRARAARRAARRGSAGRSAVRTGRGGPRARRPRRPPRSGGSGSTSAGRR